MGEIIECAQEETGNEALLNWQNPLRGVEDCLVVNIYTPKVGHGDYPVMVFFHGGGYFAGSGSPGIYGPEYLMDHGVILVTVNYRLGPFGFLSFGDDELPGNQGMWDAVLALKFIHERIEHFGGDPTKITLFGESAGSMVVQLLMLTGHVSELFRGAILQSGPILSAFAHSDKNPAYYGRTFASALGCDPAMDSSVIVQCLQMKDATELVSHIKVFDHQDKVMLNAPNPWKPVFDGHFLKDTVPFLSQDPLNLLEEGNFPNIPVIIGENKDEGLYAIADILARTPNAADIIFDDWPHHKGPSYLFGREEDEIDTRDSQFAAAFLEHFLEGGNTRDPHILQNWFGPSVWTSATIKVSDLLSDGKESPTYVYQYTHPGSLSLTDLLSYPLWKNLVKLIGAKLNMDLFPNSLNGSTHFDEIFMLFKSRSIPFLKRHTDDDLNVSKVMLEIWTDFAKSGMPLQKWTPYKKESRSILEIGTNTLKMTDADIFHDVVKFWSEVWERSPPTMHLWRSKTWSNSSLYADLVHDRGNQKEL